MIANHQRRNEKVVSRSNSTIASSTYTPCNSRVQHVPTHASRSFQAAAMDERQQSVSLKSTICDNSRLTQSSTNSFEQVHLKNKEPGPSYYGQVLLQRSGTGTMYVPRGVAVPPTMADRRDSLQSMVLQRSRAKIPTLADECSQGGFEAIAVRTLDGALTAGILTPKKGDQASVNNSTRIFNQKKSDRSTRRVQDPWEHAIADLILW